MNAEHGHIPAPGEVIDSWVVDRLLGEGGMGAVVRAYHVRLQTPVALKLMHPRFVSLPGAVERFLNEGRASSRIKSDHVVPVTHAGELADGTPFLVMEYLEGKDLQDLLTQEAPNGLPTLRAVHFLVQILRALQAAHAVGIVHRDMKPSNCFVVNADGEEDFVKILDFGISKVAQPGGGASLTQTNSALGTPLYMSPEQARSPRDVDGRSDIYSTGVILYELLTGKTPFFSEGAELTEILFKLFTSEPPPIQSVRPDLEADLAAVVHKALAREPDDRYGTPLEMAIALEPFASPRTRALIDKMRAFRAPVAGVNQPPEHLAPSMAAFSQLQARGGTNVMDGRPRMTPPKAPQFTDVMEGAPGRVVVGSSSHPGEAVARTLALAPPSEAAPREGSLAHTPGSSPMVAAAPSRAPTSKRAILAAFASAVVVGGAIIAIVTALRANREAPASDPVASEPPALASAAASVSAAPLASAEPAEPAPSASSAASAASAAASASAAAPTKSPPPRQRKRIPGVEATFQAN